MINVHPFDHGPPSDAQRPVLRRGALGLAILLAHIGLIVMVIYGVTSPTRQAAVTPILVTLLPKSARAPENLTLPRAASAPPPSLSLAPPPELELPADRSDTLLTAPSTVSAANTEQRLPAASSPQPAPNADLQTLSTVAYIQRPAPAYPRESRLAREEGLVVLRVLIDESGHVRDIEVYRSSGHPRLDKEARAAVARAIFKPYVADGVARAAIAMVPIEFSLRSKS